MGLKRRCVHLLLLRSKYGYYAIFVTISHPIQDIQMRYTHWWPIPKQFIFIFIRSSIFVWFYYPKINPNHFFSEAYEWSIFLQSGYQLVWKILMTCRTISNTDYIIVLIVRVYIKYAHFFLLINNIKNEHLIVYFS